MLRNRKLRDNHCQVQNIEDEFQFLMECTKYKFNHKVTLTHIEGLCPDFKRLPPRDKFIYIMSAKDDICEIAASVSETTSCSASGN